MALLCIVATLAATVLAAPRDARAEATTTASAGARVAVPIILKSEIFLNFGKLKGGRSDGTVVVTTNNTRNATGGAKIFPNKTFSRGEFTVQGEPGAQYAIQLPAYVAFSRHNKNRPIPHFPELQVVQFFTFSVNAAAPGFIGQLGTNGKDTFYLGGVLEVPKNAKTGEYRGTMNVTIDYQ